MFCQIGLQATTIEMCPSYWKLYHWQSGHNGAPEYFRHAVRDILNNAHHDRWIGREPTAWPPRPPDLNPLNFYLWVHLNATPVDNEETHLRRIVDACQTIRNCPGISERMRRSMMRRVEACIESYGGHFERLLQMYFRSYNSQIKCFRTHVDMNIFFFFWYVELVPEVCLSE
jgi:hypothetical protein